VYFGLNDEPGDLDETAKFPDAVAMVWRWTGDSKFRDDLYDFSKRNLQYLVNLTSSDDDLWPDGSGNVESSVLGADAVDVAAYTMTKAQVAYTLNTGVMAVGLGNYGLLGPTDQQRYTDDLAQLQIGSVEEQPGTMPEIGPSPDFAANVTQPFNERSSLDQAWGTYGVLWRWCTSSWGSIHSLATACSRCSPV